MSSKVWLELNQLSIKWRSKKELYDVLASDWGIYMPPIQYANSNYVSGVITGDIKVRINSKSIMLYSM